MTWVRYSALMDCRVWVEPSALRGGEREGRSGTDASGLGLSRAPSQQAAPPSHALPGAPAARRRPHGCQAGGLPRPSRRRGRAPADARLQAVDAAGDHVELAGRQRRHRLEVDLGALAVDDRVAAGGRDELKVGAVQVGGPWGWEGRDGWGRAGSGFCKVPSKLGPRWRSATPPGGLSGRPRPPERQRQAQSRLTVVDLHAGDDGVVGLVDVHGLGDQELQVLGGGGGEGVETGGEGR
jgi:hypothetical protein